MARPLFCPWCRRSLPAGHTNCPRCGLRIAPLERQHRDVEAALEAARDDPAGLGAAVAAGDEPLSLRRALLVGVAGGVALVALAAAIALAVSRGRTFNVALSNAAFFTGGVTLTLALVLGGVRITRLLGDIELMKRRARGERPSHTAPDNVRLCVATAAAVPLLLAIALAATVR